MDQVARITSMEKILDQHREMVDKMDQTLTAFADSQSNYQILRRYYGSPEYMKDYDDSRQGLIPAEIKCGILSEDAAFDLIGDNFHLAIKMLELATDIIKYH